MRPETTAYTDINQVGSRPHPDYVRANVLLSSDFRYFGDAGTDQYKAYFPSVRRAVEHLGRGHLVNLSGSLTNELLQLKRRYWRKTSRKVLGRPTNVAKRGTCYRGGNWKEVC